MGHLVPPVYFSSRRNLQRAQELLYALHDGLWLGLLSTDALHALDESYYNRDQRYTRRLLTSAG